MHHGYRNRDLLEEEKLIAFRRIFLNSAILLSSGCFSLGNIENLVLNLRPGSVY